MRQPNSVCANGASQRALAYFELDQQPSKLIGFGCDGANVNMGANGVNGHIHSDRPWLVTVWCFAHRLELAIKDALCFLRWMGFFNEYTMFILSPPKSAKN